MLEPQVGFIDLHNTPITKSMATHGGLPLERLELLGWVIEVDAAQTAAYYALSSQCDCAYCHNFVAAMEQWPVAIREALRLAGVDPAKLGKIMEFGENPNGLHDYLMICPVVGRILSEPPPDCGSRPC